MCKVIKLFIFITFNDIYIRNFLLLLLLCLNFWKIVSGFSFFLLILKRWWWNFEFSVNSQQLAPVIDNRTAGGTIAGECTSDSLSFRAIVNVANLPQEGFFMIYTDPSKINLEPKDDLYVTLFLFLECKWTQYFEIVQNCGPLIYHLKKN